MYCGSRRALVCVPAADARRALAPHFLRSAVRERAALRPARNPALGPELYPLLPGNPTSGVPAPVRWKVTKKISNWKWWRSHTR
eukprot:361100-Chlamydomonas_euryale.AAC.11